MEEAHASPDRSSCKMLSASHDRSLEPPVLLNVRARDHIVYLYGTVSTESQRELAADVAAATQGVEKVENMMTLAG
jgi:osmotically-inducible protein OsmY